MGFFFLFFESDVPEEVVDPVGCTEVDWEGDVAPDLLAASSRGRFFWMK